MSQHADEDLMDLYSLGTLPESECAVLEEHLLICEACRQRVLQNDAMVTSFRSAGVVMMKSRASRKPQTVSRGAMAAGAVFLVAAGIGAWRIRPQAMPPAMVMLQATRGLEAGPQAPAGRPLDLRLDLTDLPVSAAYRVEIVDHFGATVLAPSRYTPGLRVAALRPGVYFVRLYAPGGVLLREYGLEAVPR